VDGSGSWHAEQAWLGRRAENVLIEVENGRITSVVEDAPAPRNAVALKGWTVPGFANVHSHAFQHALRGKAAPRPEDALRRAYRATSLALLAVLVRYAGLGFWTAVVALVAYAQFALVRNIAAGLRGVPPAARDAARGLGMSARQLFWRVEMPLAFPVMLGGVRVATVAMIAIATLAAYASAGGLGVLIFDGLERQYPAEALAGSIPATLLAIAADTLFRALERRATRYAH